MKIEFESFQQFAQLGSLIGMSVLSMQAAFNSAKTAFDGNKTFHGALQDAFDSYTQIVVSCEKVGIEVEDYKSFEWWCSQFINDDVFTGVVRAYIPKLNNTQKELRDVLKCQK